MIYEAYREHLNPIKIPHASMHCTPKREVVSPSLAGGAKCRDLAVNHGIFITFCPIIKNPF